jgi:hypothetical protein
MFTAAIDEWLVNTDFEAVSCKHGPPGTLRISSRAELVST